MSMFATTSCATHKPRRVRYHSEIDTRISGIPCGIRVDRVDGQDGDSSNDASDWDHDGYVVIEFTVLDSKGYEAPWLEMKLSDSERHRIETEILKHMADE